MSIRKIILVALFASLLSAAPPTVLYCWQTVFEVGPATGRPGHEYTIQAMIDPQSIVTVGIEVMGAKIGYDSRYGFGTLMEF